MPIPNPLPTPNISLREAIGRTGQAHWRVAVRAGLTPTVLSLIVTGRRHASDGEAARLAEVLNVPVELLFPGDGSAGLGDSAPPPSRPA